MNLSLSNLGSRESFTDSCGCPLMPCLLFTLTGKQEWTADIVKLVSRCFEPSQPLGATSGLNTLSSDVLPVVQTVNTQMGVDIHLQTLGVVWWCPPAFCPNGKKMLTGVGSHSLTPLIVWWCPACCPYIQMTHYKGGRNSSTGSDTWGSLMMSCLLSRPMTHWLEWAVTHWHLWLSVMSCLLSNRWKTAMGVEINPLGPTSGVSWCPACCPDLWHTDWSG